MRLSRTAVCCLVSIAATFGQSDRGTINGTITDPADAVVPGATVVALNAETAAQYQTVTTQTGNFTISSLPVGVYGVTVEAPGFKRFTQQGVTVEVAQTARVDISFQVGARFRSPSRSARTPRF